MIKFIDIHTGNVYDGEYPHVHWFEGQQGINLIYSMPICFVSDEKYINVSLPDNPVFKLINLKTWDDSTQIEYQEIKDLYTTHLDLIGTTYKNKYLFLFYISGSSDSEGEFIEDLYINDRVYKIGADFYAENESLYINLSNNGINIPDSVQKAIYPVNVHEDYKDIIVLNRKWKELLSNYRDIQSNKGSYKSLLNSLNWFEWGDTVKLYEIWKSTENDNLYSMKNLQAILSDNYLESLNGFAKTTYLSLISALEQIVFDEDGIVYDDEKNPLLKNVSHIWSIQDLSLKISMLGNFYETYFMPIHLDLIHSTIEDVIYSNTFKLQSGGTTTRNDFLFQSKSMDCNIEKDSVFELDYVNCRTSKNALFAHLNNDCDKYEDIVIVGVEEDPNIAYEDSKMYLSQRYNDIGCIVGVVLTPKLEDGDFIYNEKLSILKNGKYIFTVEDHKIITSQVDFNILLKEEGNYTFNIQFNSAGGDIFTKTIEFVVCDKEYISLNLYKVKPIDRIDIGYHGINDYIHTIHSKESSKLFQFIPVSKSSSSIKLSNVLVLEGNHKNKPYIYSNYFTFLRNTYLFDIDKFEFKVQDDELIPDKLYTICISKTFDFTPDLNELNGIEIYKNQNIFIPDFYTLSKFGGNDIKDYIVTNDDLLGIIPNIKHSKPIIDPTWEFVNVSTQNHSSIKLDNIYQPFVADSNKTLLEPGYYSIIFRYRLSGEQKINEIKLDSAFIKK